MGGRRWSLCRARSTSGPGSAAGRGEEGRGFHPTRPTAGPQPPIAPPPSTASAPPPPPTTLVPRRSRPHSNRWPHGNAPPSPPRLPSRRPHRSARRRAPAAARPSAAARRRRRGAGRSAASSRLRRGARREGGKGGRRAAKRLRLRPSPPTSYRSAAPAPSTPPAALARVGRGGPALGGEGGSRGCAARALRFPLRRHLALASRRVWLCDRGVDREEDSQVSHPCIASVT